MCADDRNGDLVGVGGGRDLRQRRLRNSKRAHRQAGVGVECPADGGQERIVAARREQRDAERDAVRPHRGRHGEPAQIEQVDEVGVGAEPAVELERIGQHLIDGVDGGRGRYEQCVDRRNVPSRTRRRSSACRRP